MYSDTNKVLISIIMVLAVIISPVLSISFGAANINFNDVFAAVLNQLGGNYELSSIKQRIIIELRMPRILMAFLAGAGLSLAGAVLQNVTRNPLADPYLFGISSGASFGAVLVIAVLSGMSGVVFGEQADSIIAAIGIPLGAFIGSALSVMLVVSLSGNGVQIERMILAGVATSFMFSAATSMVLYMSDPRAASSLLFWSLGSFSRVSWDDMLLPIVAIVFALSLFIGYGRQLRAVLAGDENARALGVHVTRLRMGMLLLSSFMTAMIVAYCGGIGFVGLMVPHLVRRFVGSNSVFTMIMTALFGGVFLIWVDVVARTLLVGAELPIGVITAAIGSVFFLLVLRRRSWLDG